MILIQLYGPALLSIVLIIVSIRIKIKDEVLFTIKPPFLELSIPIKSVILCRAILVCLSLGCVYRYFIMDFSHFFPEKLEMEAFFDEEGLRESLSKYSSEELNQIGVIDNNRESLIKYYQDVDKTLKEMLGYERFFTSKDGTVRSYGELSFQIEKNSGFHKYHIAEVEGSLTHELDRKKVPTISCKSIFEKQPSRYDYISLSLSDVIKGNIIIQPRFKQILKENDLSSGRLYDHIIVAITRVNFFPVPYFGRTTYLFERSDGSFVPIGYAVYKY